MHILLTTYGLMLVMALFSMAQWRQAENLAYFDAAARDVFVNTRLEIFEDISQSSALAYSKQRPKKDKKEKKETAEDEEELDTDLTKPDSLNDQKEQKPKKKRTKFLHISALFNDENPNIGDGKGRACFALLKNLITELYSNQAFFEDAKETYPDLEERLVLNMIEKAKEKYDEGYEIGTARELAVLNLDDRLQSYVRYKMMSGNKSHRKGALYADPGYFPLIEFVSMKENSHLASLWLAPRPLLMALFQNEDVVEDVIKARHEIYNELRKDKNKSTQDAKNNELKLRFSSYLAGIDPNFIDFEVSRTFPRE